MPRQLTWSRRAAAAGLLFLLAAIWLVIALVHVDERQQVATGIGTGAAIAAIALVVVLTHRGSGVVNFAAGSMAMYFAYTYLGLRTEGKLMIPPLPNPLAPIEGIAHKAGAHIRLPHWPTMIKLGGGSSLSTPVAFVITLAVAVVMGCALYYLVFRPLRNASELARAVASIGLLILFEAIVVLRFGDQPQQLPSVLPTSNVHFAGVTAPQSYYDVALITVALAAGLWAGMRYTRFGLATIAAAEKEKAVVLLGYSPDVLATANWVAASVIAALVGIFATPLIGLTPTGIAFMVVPALAAALLGGMSSFGIATISGLALGVAQALVSFYGTRSWYPKYGHGDAATPYPGIFQFIVLAVILLTLLLRSRPLPMRGAPSRLRLPRSVRPRHALPRTAVMSVMAIAAMLTLPSAWRLGLTNSVIGVMIALSVVILTGFVAQVSVAQLSIAGVAAFVMAKIAFNWGLAFPIGPIIAIAVATAFSLLLALPALRIRGVNLAIVTLAIVEFVQNFVFQLATKGGSVSGVNVAAPRLFGLKFGPDDPTKFRVIGDSSAGQLPNPFFGVFCIIVAALVVLLVYWIRRSGVGLRFLAVRSNESASATSGVNTVRTKLLAFALSSLVAGIAGVVSAYRFGSVTPDYFGDVQSLTFFAFAYLGGLGGVSGAVAAGLFAPGGIGVLMGSEWFGIPIQFTTLVGGIGLVLTVVLNPDGIGPRLVDDNLALWNKHIAGRFGLPRYPTSGTSDPGIETESATVSAAATIDPDSPAPVPGSLLAAGSAPVETG